MKYIIHYSNSYMYNEYMYHYFTYTLLSVVVSTTQFSHTPHTYILRVPICTMYTYKEMANFASRSRYNLEWKHTQVYNAKKYQRVHVPCPQHVNNITSKHVLCTLQVLMELDRQTGSLHHKDNNSSNFALY